MQWNNSKNSQTTIITGGNFRLPCSQLLPRVGSKRDFTENFANSRISIQITLDSPSRFLASPRLKRSTQLTINFAPILRAYSLSTRTFLPRSIEPPSARCNLEKSYVSRYARSVPRNCTLARNDCTQRKSINAFAEQLWKIDSEKVNVKTLERENCWSRIILSFNIPPFYISLDWQRKEIAHDPKETKFFLIRRIIVSRTNSTKHINTPPVRRDVANATKHEAGAVYKGWKRN